MAFASSRCRAISSAASCIGSHVAVCSRQLASLYIYTAISCFRNYTVFVSLYSCVVLAAKSVHVVALIIVKHASNTLWIHTYVMQVRRSGGT